MRGTRPPRRNLVFADLAQVMPDVRRARRGHRITGNWTLAQICKHLADSINGSIDGLDGRRHRIKRFFFRRLMLRTALHRGIPTGYTVDERLTPPVNVDLDRAVEELASAIDRYEAHGGSLGSHPLFGRLNRDEWDRVHCVHCAHHLSFVLPHTK